MSYDMIDRFLRNNLDDDNYAEYSAALDELCTPPAQRTWVGLTDEEAFQICVDCGCLSEDWLTLLDAIEAKLRSKNK